MCHNITSVVKIPEQGGQLGCYNAYICTNKPELSGTDITCATNSFSSGNLNAYISVECSPMPPSAVGDLNVSVCVNRELAQQGLQGTHQVCSFRKMFRCLFSFFIVLA